MTKLGLAVVVVVLGEVIFTFFTDFLLPSLNDFVLFWEGFLFWTRLFNSFLKLNNGDAVASTIGTVFTTEGVVVVLLAVELFDVSLCGLILLLFNINIPELA